MGPHDRRGVPVHRPPLRPRIQVLESRGPWMGTVFRTCAALETDTRTFVALWKPMVRVALERIPSPAVVAFGVQARASIESVHIQDTQRYVLQYELLGIGGGVGPGTY